MYENGTNFSNDLTISKSSIRFNIVQVLEINRCSKDPPEGPVSF